MVEEHLCTVAVDVAMGEEHADGEGRLGIIGQVKESLMGIPAMSISQLVFLFGLLWLVMCSYSPPPPGADSLKTCQRDDKDLYSSESFVRILSYVKGLSEHVSG